MPHIHDLKPSKEVEFPHQIMGYKGDALHNDKELTDSHSVVIDKQFLAHDAFTLDDYLNVTAGKPDPHEIYPLVEWLIDCPVISDLSVLGTLGNRIQENQKIAEDFRVNPFSFWMLRKDREPRSLEVMQELLSEKGILSKVEARGAMAISFQGLPCPLCGKTTSNARAYPPSYTLKCLNSNCEASVGAGVPLFHWAKIKNRGSYYNTNKKSYDLTPPTNQMSLADARNLINTELRNRDNSLLVVTPGVGKTHSAMEHVISEMGEGKVIVYAAFNRQLQEEAYNKCIELLGHSNGLHLLQSQAVACQRSGEVENITDRGFSPKELLCNSCKNRDADCEYFKQRKNLGPGVYFVTLHMLQYLVETIPKPDLLILDENLKAGFLLEETCSERKMKSLLKIVPENDARLIRQLLSIFQRLSVNLVKSDSREITINSRKLTEADETTIIDLLSKWTGRPEEETVSNLLTLSNTLNKLRIKQLYFKGIDMKAITWINSLCSRTVLAFVQIDNIGEINFKTKRITHLAYHDTPLKILDATGDAESLEPLVRRKLKTVRADVGWESNRVHIKKSLSRKDMALATEKDLEKLLTDMLSHTQAQKIMVITYMKHEDEVLRILKAIDPAREFMMFHFLGPRGINDYAICEAVLVIGLPYTNLNSAAQDACLLFPNERDVDKRIDWAEANMQWEFVQAIHRIRPIYKNKVDIVLAANNWPTSLEKPTLVIDKSKENSWKEIAINRLKPLVDKYGFLNQDVGFLANVFVKQKESIAVRFQSTLWGLAKDLSDNQKGNLSQFCKSLFCIRKDLFLDKLLPFEGNNFSSDKEKLKSINVIKIIITKIYLQRINSSDLLVGISQNGDPGDNGDRLILSNSNQWSSLLIDFKERNPHFESFKIKLPHARGNYVQGVGNPERVKEFYKQINDLGIVGKVNIDSYRAVKQSESSVNPIPEGYVSVYLHDDEDLAYVAWGSEFSSMMLHRDLSELKSFFESHLLENHRKIVTNNGKKLAQVFMKCGLTKCEIVDVVITEKLIANGEINNVLVNLDTVFKRNDITNGLERGIVTRSIYEVWEKQEALIASKGLEKIFSIESKLLWVTAKIENAGVGVDINEMLRLHDDSDEKLKKQIESYWEKIGLDDRYRDDIDQFRTTTGRFERSLLRVPRSGPLRSLFRTREGYKLVKADYSQEEPRIMAALSGDQAAVALFKAGKDIYLETARIIFGDRDDIFSYRGIGKEIVIGLINGRRSYKICDRLNEIGFSYDPDQVMYWVSLFNQRFPGISTWRSATAARAKKEGSVTTKLGRLRKISDDDSDDAICNHPMQGIAADVFKIALIELDEKLADLDAEIVHIMHDEIIIEARADVADHVAGVAKECMEGTFAEIFPEVQFVVDPKVGDTWGKDLRE
ncbi:DNA polymerase family A [Desulforhopalus singaporensis]|uniref:DNA polymerase family A n=2 Tax=Desulforhopalus singaporensis TaxID=91360 RepID=A0A1H0VRF8_9BACT|nr:DNA polymerase family A [Desulforhopalus singaporensis]